MRKIACTMAALLLPFPAAAAEWRTLGSFEPDTPHDNRAREEPNQEPWDRLYFNVVLTGGAWGYANPNAGVAPPVVNVGEARTRMLLPAPVFSAYLGLWRDCNRDGYVGSARGALAEYRAETGFDPDVCPWGGPHVPGDGNVHEFRWIVRNGPANDWDIVDPTARVWGDVGLPGEPVPSSRAVKTWNDYTFGTPSGTSLDPTSSSATPWAQTDRPVQAADAGTGTAFFTDEGKLAGAHHYTFYASFRSTLLPSGSVPDAAGTYAREWCQDHESGISRGFDCDPQHWTPPVTPLEADLGGRPFDPYKMRDVDCYDQTVAPGVGTSAHSEAPACPRP